MTGSRPALIRAGWGYWDTTHGYKLRRAYQDIPCHALDEPPPDGYRLKVEIASDFHGCKCGLLHTAIVAPPALKFTEETKP